MVISCQKKIIKIDGLKTPRHIYFLDQIFDYFPGAKVIYITRNGKAVTASMKKRYGNFYTGMERWIKDNAALDNTI